MKQHNKLTAIDLEKIIKDIADKVLNGNTTPWVIFPSIPITYKDLEKYRKINNEKNIIHRRKSN